MKRVGALLIFCLAAGLASLLAARPAPAKVVDRVVAVVNDDIITMSELELAMKMVNPNLKANPKSKEGRAFKREMLEALIDRKLARAEAKRRGIAVSDKEVDQAVADFKKRNHFPDDATMTQALAKAGMTVKDLRQQLHDQIQQERLVLIATGAKNVEVSDAEVRRFYDANFREGGGGKQVHLRMINLPYPPGATEAQKEEVQKKAESILKDVRLSGSLAAAQQKEGVSIQDLGFINQGDLNPQLAAVIGKLRPREVAAIHSPQGFQLVVVVERRTGKPPSLEEVAPQIRRILASQDRQKQFLEWVKTLRAKAHIKIML